MWKTRITQQFEIEFPLIGAGMAFAATAPLVTAVSEAGGMGVLGSAAMSPEMLQDTILQIRRSTGKPFGIDIIPRFATAEHIQIAMQARVPVVVFFWDDPQPEWVDSLKSAGTRVWMQVGSPDEARKALAMGADALVVQGSEAGGHNRAVASLFSLLPVIADQSPVPVIAAGGIADGRGVAAALSLSAEAVWVGTRLVASVEANSHAGYKQRIVEAGVGDTERHFIFGPEFPDASVRGIRNRIVREWSGRDNPPPYKTIAPESLPVIGEADVYGMRIPMTRFMGIPPTANSTGDLEEMDLLAGESVGLIRELKPARDIVRGMMAEAENVLRDRLSTLVV